MTETLFCSLLLVCPEADIPWFKPIVNAVWGIQVAVSRKGLAFNAFLVPIKQRGVGLLAWSVMLDTTLLLQERQRNPLALAAMTV